MQQKVWTVQVESLDQDGANGHEAVTPTLAWRETDLTAVRHNVRVLTAASAPAHLMVVVKADAYSHGAVEVARAALEAGASHLGVATLPEAFELRHAGVRAPLLAWLAGPSAPYADAVARDVELAAYGCRQLDEIADAVRGRGLMARLHLKVETGMWRGGAAGEWPALVARARALEDEGVVQVIGVWSHLACADVAEHPATEEQRRAFVDAVQVAAAAGLRPRLRHLANSAATLTRPDMHFDMVRCGLAVYGVNPLTGARPRVELKPAVTVKARVTHVKEAPPGAAVSYGHTYRTSEPTRLALVPMGYADGIPAVPPTARPVGYRGSSVRIAGRVCMDQLVLDVGDLPIAPGDTVTLLGTGGDGEHTAEQWAALSGRSQYEMLTGLARRRVGAVHLCQ